MNNFYQGLKRWLLFVKGCCVVLSISFLFQIKEMRMIGQLGEQTDKMVTALEADNKALSDHVTQMTADLQYFMQEYQRIVQAEKSVAESYTELETEYAKGMYLDAAAMELDKESGRRFCIERYLGISKWELQETIGEVSGKLEAAFPNADKWGCLLPVGDKIWLQYNADDSKNSLPAGLVIQNPNLDLGYKDARAGMYLFDIKERYSGSEVEETGLEQGNIRYLRYEDEEFLYYYLAISEYGDTVILYITSR